MSEMTDEFEERVNTGRCVVAIPTATEPIHHVGDVSEPKHMTVLWLGTPEENPDLDMEAVQDAVRGQAEQSGLLTGTVESQGPLGEDGAQVAFLRGDELDAFREGLLADPVLREGAGSVQQHPEFTPHVTLGYDTEPVPEGDLPEEVIFDRVAVWDGDEHTEYPLGPSASSEENTEGPEDETVPDMALEFSHLVDVSGAPARLQVNDVDSLATACRMAEAIPDERSRASTQRVLAKRARELGCQHVIPSEWNRQGTPSGSKGGVKAHRDVHVSVVTSETSQDATAEVFRQKTEMSGLSDTALHAAYLRGVREYTMTAPQSRPPLPRDMIAQARVNSLIRLAQGDPSARTDDRDLLR